MNWRKQIVLLAGFCFISADNEPEDFDYNQSTSQASYFIESVTINGIAVDANDWVGAFKGDICVGSRKWDTTGYCSDEQYTDETSCEGASETWTWNLCNGGVCDVPAMGYDGTDWTAGYMTFNNLPTFKIYDSSKGEYYNASPTENYPWMINSFPIINNLNASLDIDGCTNYAAPNYDPFATVEDGSCNLDIDIHTIPGNYSITSIYPNPFNPITRILYSLPENSEVKLNIYNMHGRQMQTLKQGFQTAGTHSINWNASNYPSGVYLIRLDSGEHSNTNKVILIK
jgi:hypothetical protein